jgi:uncharacterized protein (DUF1684 family)/outer membrane protein assembly factor BamB
MPGFATFRHNQLFFVAVFSFAVYPMWGQSVQNYALEIEKWREERVAALKSPLGWLSLAGLTWLHEGIQSFGSDQANAVRFPEDAPPKMGDFKRHGDSVWMETALWVPVFSEGKRIHSALAFPGGRIFQSGRFSWTLLQRGDKIGVRFWDAGHQALSAFEPITYFPIEESWRVEAQFIPWPEPSTIKVANILGMQVNQKSPGVLQFVLQNQTFTLTALEESPASLFIAFTDGGTGDETYGGGRYLSVPMPGPEGRTTIDFNKAYNPPCAFTAFATCLLPVSENHIDLPILAGEKNYAHPKSHEDSPGRRNFRFAVLTDTHIGGSATAAQDLQRTIADINADSTLVFAILTGDVTELGWDNELDSAKVILHALNKPLYIIPGNHDTKWSESGNQSFKQIFGGERFFFNYGGFAFIGCSSGPNMRMAPGLVPAEDLTWLDSIVQTLPPDKPLFFFNHYPLDSSLGNWYKVTDILKSANIQATFCGHGHSNKVLSSDGIPASMLRSNLRSKEEVGAYTIATVTDSLLELAIRHPGVKTMAPWRSIPLGISAYSKNNSSYPRPSYDVNNKYPQVKTLWKIQDPCDIGSGIIVDRQIAWYANTCGMVKAIHPFSGATIWTFQTAGKIYATPAKADNFLLVASTDSTLYCLDAESGQLRWTHKSGKALVASPIVAENTVLLGTSEGIFKALNLQNGALRWSFRGIGAFVETKPVADKKRVYFGAWDRHFYALNLKDGTLAWKWNNGLPNRMLSPASVHPVLSHNKVFIVAPDRYATALNTETGKVVWRTDKKVGRESIGISEDGKTVYVKAMNDTIHALNATTNTLDYRWALHCGYGYDIAPSPMVESGGLLFVPTDKGAVFAVEVHRQRIQWIHKIGNALINNVVPLDKHHLIGTSMDGQVFLIYF